MSNFSPYQNEALNLIYQLLFCDQIELYQNQETKEKYPWPILFSLEPSVEDLQKIINSSNLQTRMKILAYRKLAEMSQASSKKDLLGIIIEVAMEEGLDTLAAYRDGTARYINHAEHLIAWDKPNHETLQHTQNIFNEGQSIIEKIGPWDKPRLEPPPQGQARLTFLVSDQIYFGQGPINVLFNDPIAKTILQAATEFMQYLIKNAHR